MDRSRGWTLFAPGLPFSGLAALYKLTVLNKLMALVWLAALLGGCDTMPHDATQAPRLSAEDQALVDNLIEEAKEAFEQKRLTTPAGNNAYDRYLQALAIDPGNIDAADGVNSIVEQYLSWAMEKAKERLYSTAASYVAKAKAIDAGHPNIAPVVRMIDDAKTNRERVFSLDKGQISDRQVDSGTLKAIVQEILGGDAFVLIRAPDDASGRWLYQQLNRLTSTRLEASLEIGLPPAVTVTR